MSAIIFTHFIVASIIAICILVQSNKQEKNGTDLALLALLLPPVAWGLWQERAEVNDNISGKYLFWTAFSTINAIFFGSLFLTVPLWNSLTILFQAPPPPSPPARDAAELVTKGVGLGIDVVSAGLSLIAWMFMALIGAIVMIFLPLAIRGDKYIRPAVRP